MRRLRPIFATAVAFATLSAVAFTTLPAAASTASRGSSASRGSPASLPRVLDCAGKAVVRPSSYVLTCADANSYFDGIVWATWGPTTARARATYVQNTCTPTCVAGHFVRYPATLTLSAPVKTKYGDLFRVIHYSYSVAGSRTLPVKPI
ncbi:MAG: hypothetical protein ACRDV8_04340 [Acidimicrobiales bacterium]